MSASDLSSTNPFSPALPEPGQAITWSRLYGDSLPLLIANAASQYNGPVVCLTTDSQAAESLQTQIAFYNTTSDLQILCFPDWETLPYDSFSPHQDIISERLEALYHLPSMQSGVILVPVATFLQRLPPRNFLDAHSLFLDTGEKLNIESLRNRLEQAGYFCVSQVIEHGEFAVRGSLIDLFPMGSKTPFRIDLFDDEIETIRTFDPETQRSINTVDSIKLLPAREYPLDDAGIKHFRESYREIFPGDPKISKIYSDVSDGIASAGIEYYLPLFFDETATLFDYLPANCLVIESDDAQAATESLRDQINDRYEALSHNLERPILLPERLFVSRKDCLKTLSDHACIQTQQAESPISDDATFSFVTTSLPALSIQARAEQPAAALTQFLDNFPGRVLVTAESAGRRESLYEQLRGFNIKPTKMRSWVDFLSTKNQLGLLEAPLENGFRLDLEPAIAIITETQLFGARTSQKKRRKTRKDAQAIIQNLTDLHKGAPVVHEDNGVGRYLGLQKLSVDESETEFLVLEYAGGDKLYVPVSSLDLISRYTGASPENAPLHRLGTDQWEKARSKAANRARDVAAELLDIYARRAAKKGHRYAIVHDEYMAFKSAFPFEETIDQEQAIEAVLEDMSSPQPMDRVVCGDVGFGKTEVAMRATFIAVQGGKQVIVLVPTTLLAQQHYQSFSDRFADWPVHIEALSRFKTKKQQEKIIEDFTKGTLDVLIGTHKVLSNDIKAADLGLVIIDEEHRFGVRQKEKLKALRTEVDLLTLTATPIPRTLNMSLSGLRDLSIIATPPAQRLAVKTFISEWNNDLVKEAFLREIKRGGQVYVLHNDVQSIDRIGRELAELVPEASIGIGHGQMRERDLEQVMLDFYHHRFNTLLCTTIIESGIDIPTANTIIINRADKLGLAQLHQLRGRVGRSHHRAYAYLMVPPRKAMTADAIKRIEAIESLEDLGAGFTLATHDLEIRGAGELLGDDQSGQIHEIGFSMYTELLDRAVSALKAGQVPDLDQPLHQGTEVDLQMPALIPNDYMPDVHTRLIQYKRISSTQDATEIRELKVELIDRFGLLPDPVKNLFAIAELKQIAKPMGIRKIDVGDDSGRLIFDKSPKVNPETVIKMIQTQPDVYTLEGSGKFRFKIMTEPGEKRVNCVRKLLESLRS